jgi:hypothetical protein
MARSIRARTHLRVALFVLGTSSLGTVLSAFGSVWALAITFSILAAVSATAALVLVCERNDAQLEDWEIQEDLRGRG